MSTSSQYKSLAIFKFSGINVFNRIFVKQKISDFTTTTT